MYNNVENISCEFKMQDKGKLNLTEHSFSDKKIKTNDINKVDKNELDSKKNNPLVSKKKQVIFGWVFICVLFINLCGISIGTTNLSTYVKRIIASWAPNTENIGKIKFVSNENQDDFMEVISMIDVSFTMPFPAGVATQNEDGRIFINGNGDIMVVCCYNSTVSNIEIENTKKNVTFDCGFGIKVKYIGLDNVGVEVGNKLKKGDKVGTSMSSMIEVQVYYKDKIFDKIKVKNGKLSIF